MKSINQSIKDSFRDYECKSLTQQELDELYRKCRHLHDEQIILTIGRFFKMMKNFFRQNEMIRRHASPSK